VQERVKLTVKVDEGLTAVLSNTSSRPVSFFLESCGICFWAVSVNGNPYQSLSSAMHAAPCQPRNVVVLGPGKSTSHRLGYDARLKGRIRLRYRYSEDREHFLVSNEIEFQGR